MDYRVIKTNDVFLVTDKSGNIPADHPYGLGMYRQDTRFLSKWDVRINGIEPMYLTSDASENYHAAIRLTNPHMEAEGDVKLWRESLEIKRERFIYQGVLYETIRLTNFHPKSIAFNFSLHIDADFKDMFIVRGFQKGDVGHLVKRKVEPTAYDVVYDGIDGHKRTTSVRWDETATSVSESGDLSFDIKLERHEEKTIDFKVLALIDEEDPAVYETEEALYELKTAAKRWRETSTNITTDYRPLQTLLNRGLNDLNVLLTDIGHGRFPVAGLPWFGVPFGRDSMIAALQMLAFNPEVAKGTLKTMAAYQGKEMNDWRDEQPGKIMHELRFGELANTNQIPFAPYYGSIDSTPLFLVLFVEYISWTGDLNLFEELEANINTALKWIDNFGDRDRDGFVEYHQESAKGIANQGWKDSGDSIVHQNGEYAESPIALSEVQGYVYHAKKGLARLYAFLKNDDVSQKLEQEADVLQAKFDQQFWIDDRKFYAIALDRNKSQVGTITSNPGHLLYSRMLTNEKAKQVAQILTSDKLFSGYGIRTMAKKEAAYNPMSYHNGSVWPHDNSLIILGLVQYQFFSEATRVIKGLIEAAQSFEYDRLPELFCGYDQSVGEPVPYPIACSPQAWAAGTPLLFTQAMLGLEVDALAGVIKFSPNLLDEITQLTIDNMPVGEGHITFKVQITQGKPQIDIIKNTSELKVEFSDYSVSQGANPL